MRQSVKTGIVMFVAAVTVLTLIGCPGPGDLGKLSSNATISAVTVAGVPVNLGTPSKDWEESVSTKNLGHVYLSRDKLKNAKVKVTSASGAIVFYAQAKASVEPWFDRNSVFDFDAEDYLFIEAFSANHDAYNIYGIQVHTRTPGIMDFTLGGRSLIGGAELSGRPIPKFGDLGKPGAAWNAVEQEGEAWFGDNQRGSTLPVTIRPEIRGVSVRVAVAADGATQPEFEGDGHTVNTPDGLITGIEVTLDSDSDDEYIYVEVTGDENTDITYYKFKLLAKSTNRTIENPRFIIWDGNTKIGEYPVTIGRMGTASWSGSEAYGAYNNGAEVVGKTGDTSSGQHLNNVENASVLSLYLDADMDTTGTSGLRGVTGTDDTLENFIGQRPPANFRVEFAADYDGDLLFCKPGKNQRASPEFNISSGDFGNLLGFWWWGIEVTSEIGEKGWYKFATRIGSQKADILDSLTVNGVPVDFDGVVPGFASAHYDPANDFTYATVTLPAHTDFNNALNVTAKAPAGYQPIIAAVMAPNETTNVPNISFVINQDENFNFATGTNTSPLLLEPGNFIYIRVTAEISYYYGGSGFTGPTWAPNRNLTNAETRYACQRFYKVQVLKEGTQDGADLEDIKYKGVAASASVEDARVTVTTTAATITSTDRKGNAEAGVTVTNAWSAQSDNVINIDDYSNPVFESVLEAGSNKAAVAYALAATGTGVVARDQFFSPERFRNEAAPLSNTWLITRITSESGKNINFYRFHLLNTLGNDTVPGAITVNNGAVADIGDANAAVTGTTVIDHELPNKAAFDSVTIAVAKPHANAEVSFGLATANNNAPAEYTVAPNGTITYQYVDIARHVVIRIVSADRSATVYYKLRLLLAGAGDDTTITDITINGKSIGTLPDANAAVTGTTTVDYTIIGDATVFNNLQVKATAADSNAAVMYANAVAANTNVADFTNSSGLFPIWTDNQYLVIRVRAENNIDTSYYKVRITRQDPAEDE